MQSLPGHCDALADLVVEALETRQSIQHALLERFTTQEKIDRFKSKDVCAAWRSRRPPHSLQTGRVAAGIGHGTPVLPQPAPAPHKQNRGLAVYLDVSGSVDQYLPRILGVLKNLQDEIQSVFLFSNQVVEIGFKALQRGQLRSTGGTDFNCIAQSILERKFDKAVIVTDGYASMNPGLQQKLSERKLKTLTILFDRRHTARILSHSATSCSWMRSALEGGENHEPVRNHEVYKGLISKVARFRKRNPQKPPIGTGKPLTTSETKSTGSAKR
jgi:hypothetical protein